MHTRVQSCGSPVRSSVSPAREPGVRSACLQPRIHVGITIAHTFGRDKKVEECPSDPRAYTGCHACTRENESARARARPSGGTGEMMRAHIHAHCHMSFRTDTIHAYIHARIMRVYARWWPDALHPVSRLSSP